MTVGREPVYHTSTAGTVTQSASHPLGGAAGLKEKTTPPPTFLLWALPLWTTMPWRQPRRRHWLHVYIAGGTRHQDSGLAVLVVGGVDKCAADRAEAADILFFCILSFFCGDEGGLLFCVTRTNFYVLFSCEACIEQTGGDVLKPVTSLKGGKKKYLPPSDYWCGRRVPECSV